MTEVRFGGGDMKKRRQSPVQRRRRPTQSRARATLEAIYDAFVRILLERGYERATTREIALVAGVSVGALYEYFPNRQSVAAAWIRDRFQAVHDEIERFALARRGASWQALIPALLDMLLDYLCKRREEWAALAWLERRISSEEAYRALYRKFAAIWASILAQCGDWPEDGRTASVGYTLHTVVYSLLFQALLNDPALLETADFRRHLHNTATGLLDREAVMALS